ncbi:hypothetical protein NQ314_008483 [Rhamnusium bicolor]|uniref:Uncharacterized protein n=1 Tax=Rhamnusium bicolor TaxID=1586634 RepID=A0AAV8YC21_9CUCU|nr:hypothetical protein NQ314_008483 [Rhamnusium bicolor]
MSILVLFVVSYSNGADILAIIPTPSYSHQIAYTYIWRELSLRGHKVTVITTDPLKDPSLTNLTEIDMKWLYQLVGNISNIAENTLTMWNIYDITLDIMLNISDALLSHPPVQDLLQRKRNFDVLLVEFSYPELLAFAEVYRCPKILISPVDTIGYYHEKMGNPSHPVLHPDMSTPFFGSMNFIERVTSTLYSLYVFYFFDFKVIPKRQEMLKRYFDIEKTVEELLRDVDMMFLNVNPVIQGSKALGPSTISIGGQRAAISTKPLSMVSN